MCIGRRQGGGQVFTWLRQWAGQDGPHAYNGHLWCANGILGFVMIKSITVSCESGNGQKDQQKS